MNKQKRITMNVSTWCKDQLEYLSNVILQINEKKVNGTYIQTVNKYKKNYTIKQTIKDLKNLILQYLSILLLLAENSSKFQNKHDFREIMKTFGAHLNGQSTLFLRSILNEINSDDDDDEKQEHVPQINQQLPQTQNTIKKLKEPIKKQ
jgi:hypothetical protein